MKKNYRKKSVYVTLAVDFVHDGHINILNVAKNYGEVTVGLLTDKAIGSYKKLPHFTFEQRKKIVENLKQVTNIVKQNELDYTKNLNLLKPDYVIHGDDWKNLTSKDGCEFDQCVVGGARVRPTIEGGWHVDA